MMDEHLVAAQLLGIQNAIGGLDARFDGLDEKVDGLAKQLHEAQKRERANERRLSMVEGDLKTAKRFFGGLFSLLLAGMGAAINWLK